MSKSHLKVYFYLFQEDVKEFFFLNKTKFFKYIKYGKVVGNMFASIYTRK